MSSITGERECQECMFWIPDKTLAKAGEMSRAESRGLYAGQCRRSPPTFVPGRSASSGVWPTTEAGAWCGEFRKGQYGVAE